EPDGTVVLDAVVTVPSASVALVIAVVAAACVRPTTSGVATCGGPDETTSATALPVTTCVPATGFWLITAPDGTVVLDALVTGPTVRLAPVIALVAVACVLPTTFGTPTSAGGGPAARISTAVRFQRSLVGTVSLIVATLPAFATAAASDCTQNVWFGMLSSH